MNDDDLNALLTGLVCAYNANAITDEQEDSARRALYLALEHQTAIYEELRREISGLDE